ncbi:hypothetical protein ACWDTP_12405 [Mycobacterium sp. NPDC003449]
MEYHAPDELIAEFVAQPNQVLGITEVRASGGFDLNAEHPARRSIRQ